MLGEKEREREKDETKKCMRGETLLRDERGLLGMFWGERTFSSPRESVLNQITVDNRITDADIQEGKEMRNE